MFQGTQLTPEVLAVALDRVRRRLQHDVAVRMVYGELVSVDDVGLREFATQVVAELGEMESSAAPHVVEGEEPTEASAPPREAPPRPRRTRARFG